MADPLSITASIFGIVTLGFQVAKGLYQIADGIGSAGEEVRLYAREISEFSRLLAHIREQILASPDIPFNSRSLIKDVVDICDKVLESFHRLQNTLNSFFIRFKQSPKKLKQFGFRVRWIFRDKRRLLFYLDALRSQHRILNTALDLANIQNTKDKNPQSIWILQTSLRNSLAAMDIPFNNSSGGMIYSVMETNELPSSDLHVLTGQPVLVSAQETSNISNSLGHTSVQSPQIENGLDPQSSAALTVLHSNPDDHHDQSTEDEIQLLEEQIDQVLDPDVGTTAAEVWEDTRSISRKAKRLALEALCSPQASVSTTLETPPTFTHKDYTVGWICTRPVEFAVAEAMLDEQHPALPQIGNDSNAYTLGSIARHNVVLVCIPAGAMDTGAASTAVSGMLHSFPNIRIRLLVGIAGGVPNSHSDMRLGDVVVGSPIFGSGGIILLDSNNDEVDEMGTLETPPRELGNALLTLQARHMRRKTEIPQYVQDMIEANPAMRLSFSAPDPEGDLLFSAGYTHTHSDLQLPGCLSCDPSHVIARPPHRGNPAIHYGLIGWTKSVINNGLTRDAIASQRYMPSIELGTMGLINFFPCLVIRGIWNYLDSHKNRIWQRYAAATAAAYAKELLDTLPTTHVQ